MPTTIHIDAIVIKIELVVLCDIEYVEFSIKSVVAIILIIDNRKSIN